MNAKNSLKTNVLILLMSSLITACTIAAPQPAHSPTAAVITATPTIQATFTPTIVWFPPTATHTPFPTPIVTPTQDMRPTLGDILLEDDFSAQSGWSLTDNEAGSVAYGKNELTIAIGETNTYMFSYRESPIFTDFYLEITAAPSLCRDLDEYGVLIRVSPSLAHYRFSLSCNGQMRLDRISEGDISSPQPWLLSGSVPPGAPSSSRIGIAAVGDEFRFFVNGRFQFSINDPMLPSGGLGVFARSTNESAVTVNFTDLIVYEVIE